MQTKGSQGAYGAAASQDNQSTLAEGWVDCGTMPIEAAGKDIQTTEMYCACLFPLSGPVFPSPTRRLSSRPYRVELTAIVGVLQVSQSYCPLKTEVMGHLEFQ